MALVLVVLLVVWLEYTGTTEYGQFWPARVPPQYVNWCGRHYERSSTVVTLDEADAMAGGSLGQVGLTPAFMSVLAQVRSVRGRVQSPVVCPSAIFVRETDDQIEVYRAGSRAGP